MSFRRDASAVVTWAPDGSDMRHVGRLGPVADLRYSFTLPGGPSAMSAVLVVEPVTRYRELEPGRRVGIFRGALQIWDGTLDEPVPGDNGWEFAGHGAGTFGADFMAYYTSYTSQGDAVNHAISDAGRGLRWRNPYASGVLPGSLDTSQPTDPAMGDLTSYLNALTDLPGYTWYVSSPGNVLKVFTPPATPNRILYATAPPSRTLGGYFTRIWIRYQATADSKTTGSGATYATTSVENTAQRIKHGSKELPIDLSQAGVMTAAAARAAVAGALARYQAVSFAGPFTVQPGQLRTIGGVPVDLGSEQAGTVCRLILAAGSYGGEITPAVPVTFLTGETEYDDTAGLLTVTPYQARVSDLAGLLSNWVTAHTPKTTS